VSTCFSSIPISFSIVVLSILLFNYLHSVHLLLVVSISTPYYPFEVKSSIVISKISKLVVFFNELHGQPGTNIKYFSINQLSTPVLQMKHTALLSYKFSLTCSSFCAIIEKSSISNDRRRSKDDSADKFVYWPYTFRLKYALN